MDTSPAAVVVDGAAAGEPWDGADRADHRPWSGPDQDAANGNMQLDEHVPPQVRQHLDFVDVHNDGRLLLGASSLTSRYWTGDVWLYRRSRDAVDDVSGGWTAGREMASGVSCGRFIDGLGLRAVICQDLGVVEVVGWEEPTDSGDDAADRLLATHGRSGDTDGPLLALDVLPSVGDPYTATSRAVTGGADGSVRVWDLETLVPEVTYAGGHCHHVTGVSCHPVEPERLASCGLDGAVLLWDTRAPRPASKLTSGGGDRPQCCAWSPKDGATLAVGWQSGAVTLQDVASRREAVAPARRRRPLHALRWHPSRRWLAVCGDEVCVEVYGCDGDGPRLIHSDSLHADMVRGLAWQPGCDEQLVTCGWDRHVLSRAVG